MHQRVKKRLNPITGMESETKILNYSQDNWVIVECLKTGMVYLENPPEYSQLIEEFAWEKRFSEERARRKAKEPILSFISTIIKEVRGIFRKRERIESISEKNLDDIIRYSNNKGLTIVDVGCGSGSKLLKIASHILTKHQVKINAIGIELSQAQFVESNENLGKINGYCIHNTAIEGLKEVADGSVDLIILCSFLEHELKPLSLLKVCKNKLSSNGRIIIKVPNFDSLNRKVRQKRWCGFRYPDHVNYFTPTTLKLVIENAEMTLKELENFPINDNMWAIVIA